jgi:hypothetical protein
VALLLIAQQVPASQHGPESSYPEWCDSWLPWLSAGKWRFLPHPVQYIIH